MKVFGVAAVLFVSASVSAVELTLDAQTVLTAIRAGQTRLDRERAALHAPYRLIVNTPPIDYIDVVTPFRRVVLAADQRMRLGERPLSQREALELLSTSAGVIELIVELTFHPMHTLVRVPDYEVRLAQPGRAIEPRNLDRVPRFGPRLEGMPVPLPGTSSNTTGAPRTAQPMLGGSVVAAFGGFALDRNGTYDVIVTEKGKELARTRLLLKNVR